MSLGHSAKREKLSLSKLISLILIPTIFFSNIDIGFAQTFPHTSDKLAIHQISQILDEYESELASPQEPSKIRARFEAKYKGRPDYEMRLREFERGRLFREAYVAKTAERLAAKMVGKVEALEGVVSVVDAEKTLLGLVDSKLGKAQPSYIRERLTSAIRAEFAKSRYGSMRASAAGATRVTPYSEEETTLHLKRLSNVVRRHILEMLFKPLSGHPGGSLSSAEILTTLYFGGVLNYDPNDPDWENRDRVVLSAGHKAPALYAVLAEAGYFAKEELQHLRESPDGMLQGHVDRSKTPGVDLSTGALGEGFSSACGMAAGAKLLGKAIHVWSILGGGEEQEGQVSEAARHAVALGLTNQTVIIDDNDYQIEGHKKEVDSADIAEVWRGYGWGVVMVNGHDPRELLRAMREARDGEKPVCIIAKTTKGKGVSFLEKDPTKSHGEVPKDPKLHQQALEEVAKAIGGYDSGELDNFKRSSQISPQARNVIDNYNSQHQPKFEPKTIELAPSKPGDKEATRTSFGEMLVHLAASDSKVVAMSADLQPSNKMEKFESLFGRLNPENPAGRYIALGIREAHGASFAQGMALMGLVPFIGTFDIFTLNMLPQIRVAAQSNIPVIFVTTHSGVGVGEDGTSHQGIEGPGVMDIISGPLGDKMDIYEPADRDDARVVIKAAISSKRPVYLRLTRQDVPVLDKSGLKDYEKRVMEGSYVVRDPGNGNNDLIIVATGGTVANAIRASEEFERSGMKAKVINVVSLNKIDNPYNPFQTYLEDGVPIVTVCDAVDKVLGNSVLRAVNMAKRAGREPGIVYSKGITILGSAPWQKMYEANGIDANGIAEFARFVRQREEARRERNTLSLRPNDSILEHLERILEKPITPPNGNRFLEGFHHAMSEGLRGNASSLNMIPAYVGSPTGKEKGEYLAIDAGGSKLRVLRVRLEGDGTYKVLAEKETHFSDELKKGTERQLFDFIARFARTFIAEQKMALDGSHVLGFTWSFAVAQTGIASGIHRRWSKGWQTKGIVGQDVVKLLHNGFVRNGMPNINIAALCNDTIGTLAARRYADPNCDQGIILGTGTNDGILLPITDIPKWQDESTPTQDMMVNMEWAAFGELEELESIRTVYDRLLDLESENPGEHVMEKMVSGMYLGELTRLILKDLIERKMLFDGASSPAFDIKNLDEQDASSGFKTSYMSIIESDKSKELEKIDELLKKLGIPESTLADRRLLKDICDLISLRAARIAARAIASVALKMDPELSREHTIAIDGSLFERYGERAPGKDSIFKRKLEAALWSILGRKASKVKLVLQKDGSGIGAAVIAAVASSYRMSASGATANPYLLFEAGRDRGNTTIDENTVVIGTGGGDCAGLNDIIANLIRKFAKEGKRVVGIKNCYDGMVSDDYQDLLVELTPAIADTMVGLPSTILGSCRRKLSDEDLAKIIDRFGKAEALVITGGNDHLKEAKKISDESQKRGTPIITVGVPKSIDDDYQTAMLGFKSAYLLARRMAYRASVNPRKGDGKTVAVIEVMGRKSGSLTLESSKGCPYPKVVIIPERPVMIADIVEKAKAGIRNFFVSEGFSISEDDPKLQELLGAYPALAARYKKSKESPDRDTYGHPKLTGASLFVVGILEKFCGLKVERTDLTYALRGASPQPEAAKREVFDTALAGLFADKAVELVRQRKSGFALHYPSYEDLTKVVEARPAEQVYASKDLKAMSDEELPAATLPIPAYETFDARWSKEDVARSLFYGINISTLAHRYASVVEFRELSEVIVRSCGREQVNFERLPPDLKTIIEATRDSVLILIPEKQVTFTEIATRLMEIYNRFGYVNIAISKDFKLDKKDDLLRQVLDKDAILKAKFEHESRSAGTDLVQLESGVSHFIVGLFKHLKIKSTRITDIGYALRDLRQTSLKELLTYEDHLARQGVVGAAVDNISRASSSGAADYEGDDILKLHLVQMVKTAVDAHKGGKSTFSLAAMEEVAENVSWMLNICGTDSVPKLEEGVKELEEYKKSLQDDIPARGLLIAFLEFINERIKFLKGSGRDRPRQDDDTGRDRQSSSGIVDLEKVSGLPAKLDTAKGEILLGETVVSEGKWERTLKDAGRSVADAKAIKAEPDRVIYYGYRNVRQVSDTRDVDKLKMRFDITVLQPGTIGEEFIMTKGHIHPEDPSDVTKDYPEFYEVWYGYALCIQQKVDPKTGKVMDFIVTFAKTGDKVLILPGYSHRAVNIGNMPLVMANLVSQEVGGKFMEDGKTVKAPAAVKVDFSGIEENRGYGYYVVRTANGKVEFRYNKNYGEKAPPIRFAIPAEQTEELGLSNERPMYELIETEIAERLSTFLTRPQPELQKLYEDAFIFIRKDLFEQIVIAAHAVESAESPRASSNGISKSEIKNIEEQIMRLEAQKTSAPTSQDYAMLNDNIRMLASFLPAGHWARSRYGVDEVADSDEGPRPDESEGRDRRASSSGAANLSAEDIINTAKKSTRVSASGSTPTEGNISYKISVLHGTLARQVYDACLQPIHELDEYLSLAIDISMKKEIVLALLEALNIPALIRYPAVIKTGYTVAEFISKETSLFSSKEINKMTPILARMACQGAHPDLQSKMMIALDSIGKPAALHLIGNIAEAINREDVSSPDLIHKLGNLCVSFKEDAAIKEKAVKALLTTSDISGRDELAMREHIRETAIAVLGDVGAVLNEDDPILVNNILPHLKNKAFYNPDKEVKSTAVEAMSRIGKPAVQILIETLRQDGRVRRDAVEILVRVGKPAVEPLIMYVKAGSWDLQQAVREDIYALNTQGTPNAYLFVTTLETLGLTTPMKKLLEVYNRSRHKKPPYMTVRIEDDVDKAGDAFAAEIIRGLQRWHEEPEIVIHLCTGGSPFIGYRKLGGDRFLQEQGRFDPKDLEELRRRYGKTGAILDNWETPEVQAFLRANGLNPSLKPDMSKVVAFAVDGLFPQRATDYFAFVNLLNNVCDLWGIPRDSQHRRFFRGDIYVEKANGRWVTAEVPSYEYDEILQDVDKNGLKIREYQAACLLRGDRVGFALNSQMRVVGGRVICDVLRREAPGEDFRVEEVEVKPLDANNPKDKLQYRYLESMRNQAIMMHEDIAGRGGAHITLLGVGYSYEGKGHIGFCESGTPFAQTCFVNGIYDHDATFHISGAHAKEFYGFKNMFVDVNNVRMPRFGFITFGPADLMHRQDAERRFIKSPNRDISKEVYVIVIATDNYKSHAVLRAVEGKIDPTYPLSLTQASRGVYVLERAAARELHVLQHLWEFQVVPSEAWTLDQARRYVVLLAKFYGSKIRDAGFLARIHRRDWLERPAKARRETKRTGAAETYTNRKMSLINLRRYLRKEGHNPWLLAQYVEDAVRSSTIRPQEIMEYLKRWNVFEGDTIAFVNPHMDDDILAMMHIIKYLPKTCNIHAFYNSYGYTAVYSDYVLGLLQVAENLDEGDIKNLGPQDKERLFNELIVEKANYRPGPAFDYDSLQYQSEGEERKPRAKILLIDLNERLDIEEEKRGKFQNRFRSAADIRRLRALLAEVNARKPRDGGRDLAIMNYAKTSVRFMEAAPALMSLGIPYRNIHWPLDITYGSLGRDEAVNRKDIEIMKKNLADVKPRVVFFSGEGFPDFGGHSNTEMGTYISLFELLSEKKISRDTILFQWAGVWDRIPAESSQIAIALTRGELEELEDTFKYFYRSQAAFTAPVTNASSVGPQSFAEDVAVTARESAAELLSVVDLAPPLTSILRKGGGVLNYRVRRLSDPNVIAEVQLKRQELERVGPSTRLSSNTMLTGPQPYPEKLHELDSDIVKSMYHAGAISESEKKLFGITGSRQSSSGIDRMTADEIFANRTLPDKEALREFLVSRVLSDEIDSRTIIIAHDTALDIGYVAQAGERPINKYLNGKLINVRATGQKLVDGINEAIRQTSDRPYVVVTIAADGTVGQVGEELEKLGKVLNVMEGRHIPVVGLYELALRIAYMPADYTQDDIEAIHKCLNRIALNSDNTPFTLDDVRRFLSEGIIRLLPRIIPVTGHEYEAYKAAQKVLQAL